MFLRDCSAISPEQLMLFGGSKLKSISSEPVPAAPVARSDHFDAEMSTADAMAGRGGGDDLSQLLSANGGGTI